MDNLTLLCQSCHTNVHHFGWTITHTDQSRYQATGPPIHDPDNPAYRNTS